MNKITKLQYKILARAGSWERNFSVAITKDLCTRAWATKNISDLESAGMIEVWPEGIKKRIKLTKLGEKVLEECQ